MDQINETNVITYRPKVVTGTSKAYTEVAGLHWWSALMETVEIVVSANATVLPANLVKVKSVISTNGYVYYNSTNRGRVPKTAYTWFLDTAIKESGILAGLSTETAAITNGAKIVTLSAGVLPASIVGEYTIIGSHKGFYKIASRDTDTQFTITEKYRGETETVAVYQIRPMGTKTLSLADVRGDTVTDTVTVTYLEKPLPLTEDWHIIPIPNDAECVYIRSLQIAMERRGWGRASQEREPKFISALGVAKRSEPTYKEDLKPKPLFRRPRSSTSYLSNLQGS